MFVFSLCKFVLGYAYTSFCLNRERQGYWKNYPEVFQMPRCSQVILRSILTLTTLEHPSFCLKHPLPVNTLSLHVQNRCLNFMIIYVSLHACHIVYTYTFFLTMLCRPVSISVSITYPLFVTPTIICCILNKLNQFLHLCNC